MLKLGSMSVKVYNRQAMPALPSGGEKSKGWWILHRYVCCQWREARYWVITPRLQPTSPPWGACQRSDKEQHRVNTRPCVQQLLPWTHSKTSNARSRYMRLQNTKLQFIFLRSFSTGLYRVMQAAGPLHKQGVVVMITGRLYPIRNTSSELKLLNEGL